MHGQWVLAQRRQVYTLRRSMTLLLALSEREAFVHGTPCPKGRGKGRKRSFKASLLPPKAKLNLPCSHWKLIRSLPIKGNEGGIPPLKSYWSQRSVLLLPGEVTDTLPLSLHTFGTSFFFQAFQLNKLQRLQQILTVVRDNFGKVLALLVP